MHDPRLAILEGFGLSGYVARAYLSLLRLGPSFAKQVAEDAGVPQGRIYDVLEKLHARGLVELLPEVPKRYRAVAFASFLDRELHLSQERLQRLETNREEILHSFRAGPSVAAPASLNDYMVLRGPQAIQERVLASLATTHDSLLIASEAMVMQLRGQGTELQQFLHGGGRFRVLAPVTEANRAILEEASKWGSEVRHRPGDSKLSIVVHNQTRVVLLREPDDPRRRNDAVAVLLDDMEVARAFRGIGEDLWERGVPLQAYLEAATSKDLPPA